jgi:AraC-like DNA-binding protein
MTQQRARRGSPSDYEFEGSGDEACRRLDDAFGANLRLGGALGAVRHRRADHGGVAFDHLEIDARFAFDADPTPAIIAVDVLGGDLEYTREGRTDHAFDGQSLMASGWEMPFSGTSQGYVVRSTSLDGAVLRDAVADLAPGRDVGDVHFTGFVPRSPAAGARWRAVVDELSARFPDLGTLAHAEATRLLGHTFLQTFPNDVAHGASPRELDRDRRDATPAVLRAATRIIEERAAQDVSLADLSRACLVSPRTVQYAFRRHLGCTPTGYVRRVRLDLARQALRDGSVTSVGDVAARFGFFNPGRFAADYRLVFGEYPRETLLRAAT